MTLLKKQVIIVLILLLVLLAGTLSSVILLPPRFLEGGRVVEIREGQTVATIARNLEQDGVIKSKNVFIWLVWLLGRDDNIRSGSYLFRNGQSLLRVIQRITLGDYGFDQIKVTIPEGFSAEDIAKAFSKGFFNARDNALLTLAKKEEGYLFPDTYFFFPSVRAEEVIKTMKDNFNAKVGEIGNDNVIMASLLEKEVRSKEDMEIISGILWKRLNAKMRLEVDAAPITYREFGLPRHPITNPGGQAIQASLNPKDSPYWFYLSGKDGVTRYAKTFEEHKRNKVKYL